MRALKNISLIIFVMFLTTAVDCIVTFWLIKSILPYSPQGCIEGHAAFMGKLSLPQSQMEGAQ